MNKQKLASKIWESANKMRSKIEANEYKDYILGFIFYKYLSDQEERYLLQRDYHPEDIRDYVNEEDAETVQMVQDNLGYFIAYKDMFSTWLSMGSDFTVDNVRTALSSFTRLISPTHKLVFDKILIHWNRVKQTGRKYQIPDQSGARPASVNQRYSHGWETGL